MEREKEARQKAIVLTWGLIMVDDYKWLYCGLCVKGKTGADFYAPDCKEGLLPLTLDGNMCPYFEELKEKE